MPGPDIEVAMKRLYGRLAGELAWIENPPKTMARKSRDRETFLAEAPIRAARAEEITAALPHVAYVIGLYDPAWSPEETKPIRPKADWNRPAGQNITASAMDVLREAERPLEISEIVARIAMRGDFELTDLHVRQRLHTGVYHGLNRTYRRALVHDGGSPQRWALRNRGLIASNDD